MIDNQLNSSNFLDKGNGLIERFFKLQDNSDVEKMQVLGKDFEEYIAFFSDKKFENILHLIKAWINYNQTSDLASTHELILPLLTNLEFGKNEECLKCYLNIILLSYSLSMCKDYKQAFEILELIEQAAENYYPDDLSQIEIKSTAYSNFAEILLNTKYRQDIPQIEQLRIAREFNKYCDKVLDISYENDWDIFYANNLFKKAVFHNDKQLQNASAMILKTPKDTKRLELMKRTSDEYDLIKEKERQEIMKIVSKEFGYKFIS